MWIELLSLFLWVELCCWSWCYLYLMMIYNCLLIVRIENLLLVWRLFLKDDLNKWSMFYFVNLFIRRVYWVFFFNSYCMYLKKFFCVFWLCWLREVEECFKWLFMYGCGFGVNFSFLSSKFFFRLINFIYLLLCFVGYLMLW